MSSAYSHEPLCEDQVHEGDAPPVAVALIPLRSVGLDRPPYTWMPACWRCVEDWRASEYAREYPTALMWLRPGDAFD